MNSSTLKKNIHKAIDLIDDKQFLQALYDLLKYKIKLSKSLMTALQKKELSKTLKKHKEGKMKYYSVEEARKKVHAKLNKRKKKL